MEKAVKEAPSAVASSPRLRGQPLLRTQQDRGASKAGEEAGWPLPHGIYHTFGALLTGHWKPMADQNLTDPSHSLYGKETERLRHRSGHGRTQTFLTFKTRCVLTTLVSARDPHGYLPAWQPVRSGPTTRSISSVLSEDGCNRRRAPF